MHANIHLFKNIYWTCAMCQHIIYLEDISTTVLSMQSPVTCIASSRSRTASARRGRNQDSKDTMTHDA